MLLRHSGRPGAGTSGSALFAPAGAEPAGHRPEQRRSQDASTVETPTRTTLDVLLMEATVLRAGATALLGEEGRLSYSDLMVRAQNVAAQLRSRGMRPGDLVGVAGVRSFAGISGIVAILLAGGVYVPFDVYGQSAERLGRQLGASAAKLLVTDGSDPAGSELGWAGRVSVVDASAVEREFMPMFREIGLPRRLPEDPAAVIFNAAGRGVLVTHAGIVRLVTTGALMEFRSADTVLLHAGAQEHAFQLELWGPLCAGGTVALAPPGLHGPGEGMPAREYARVMRRYRVSAICARPVLLAELAEEPLAPLAQVQQAVVDASDVEPELMQRLQSGDGAKGIASMRVTGGLGTTETTSFAVRVQLTMDHFGKAEAIAGTKALVVNVHGREAASGTLGSLAVTGEALAVGYLGQPEASRSAFPEAQRQNQQRLRCFKLPVQATQLRDGSLLTGSAAIAAAARAGVAEKVMPAQLEALLGKHPLVRECVSLANAQGDGVSCVFVTLTRRDDDSAERVLREYLEAEVPAPAQPAALLLLAELPRDGEGHPDRLRLREQCDAMLRRYSAGSRPEELRARPVEVVRSIWQRLLHRMQVDPDEDFFASGGTSVQRIRLYAELNQRFPGAFTMADLRELTTIRKIVAHLDSDVARDRMLALESRGA